ncbi:MAG: hypothetical protein JKY25_01040 [Robiginitomaculum sp.]|nr:hypothetical protein [Robiginitomaculum sp.]
MKQFLRLLAVMITLAIYLPGSAQVSTKTIKPDQSVHLADSGFTFDMPDELQSKLPQDKARTAPKPKPPRNSWLDLGFLGPVFQILFYGILAAAVLYILYLILSAIVVARRGYTPKDDEEDLPETPTYQPDEETARVLLDDADKLAAQGKFAEAVHAILFRSIQDIEDKRPHHVKRSLTSREIAGLSVLSPTARAGFSTIGALVERNFFGGRPLGAGDYEISKSAYKDFAFEKLTRRKVKR